jgi:hypothetical protein
MLSSNHLETLKKIPWHEVPDQKTQAWNAIFGSSQESINLSASCPICTSKTLHRWYEIGQRLDTVKLIEGIRYVSDGSLWEWCSTCGGFFHASAYVPEWWNPPSNIQINKDNLRVIPWAIEEALEKL